MEGIGSRTGRPSSRYGSAPVFTGPVRRWQKQWVNVSSSSSSSVTYNHSNTSNSNGTTTNNVSAIRVRRWTPVPTKSGGVSESVAEEPQRRKLRYAPIVVLHGKKKEAEKGDVHVKEESKPNRSPTQEASENDDNEKKNFDNALAAKSQASQKNDKATKDLNNQPMDLDADGDDHDDDDEDHD
ncbi:uncharacterized protein LOC143596123 [Bidens hawaiensis]|uniref:uncharacterized protein LOC143559837 n=1 Tax=Bidens hawaiensis TaxID=980011 RepID=UPI00404B228B